MTSLRPLSLVLALGLALGLAGCGTAEEESAADAGKVSVADTWVRATTGTQDPSMTAAFMSVTNAGNVDVRLVGATSPAARTVEVHTMVMQDGKMVMRELEGGLEVEAGSHAHLRPGGNHLMLMGLMKPLAAGDEVALTLEFSDGTEQVLTAPVKEFTEEEDHYDPSGSPSASMTPAP